MSNCNVCGEPMPEGEEMFFYHGLSGPCPKPPLPIENEYRPWKALGLSELAYFKMRYLKMSQENDGLESDLTAARARIGELLQKLGQSKEIITKLRDADYKEKLRTALTQARQEAAELKRQLNQAIYESDKRASERDSAEKHRDAALKECDRLTGIWINAKNEANLMARSRDKWIAECQELQIELEKYKK